ncbi:MAG TPA: 2-C-methyl-D-erythritol 4-phosphate cytidylyltransferase, partial [Cryomorphaceae bacterium]|nr:2-C-methyl-D-erythritol 4-phosphate cytidylyltransferase [Cryomorphaceae bacterium]
MPNRAVIMVAGGTGTRMQLTLPKQFIPLEGKPVILHSFDAFKKFDPDMQFILVLYKGLEGAWQEILDTHNYQLNHTLIEGGKERFHSVKNGLDALSKNIDVVAIHDAVRPLVSQNTIARCFESASTEGSAIPTIPVVDTIRRTTLEGNFSIPRHELEAVQTPQ